MVSEVVFLVLPICQNLMLAKNPWGWRFFIFFDGEKNEKFFYGSHSARDMPLPSDGAKMKMRLKILRIHIECHGRERGLKIVMGEKWPLKGDFSPIFSCCPTND